MQRAVTELGMRVGEDLGCVRITTYEERWRHKLCFSNPVSHDPRATLAPITALLQRLAEPWAVERTVLPRV
jgi:hypothetical protein